MSKRDWHRQDAVNMQKHKNDEKMIKTADILNQDEKQQKNIKEKWFLNQKNIIKCMSAWSQFWSNDTWN